MNANPLACFAWKCPLTAEQLRLGTFSPHSAVMRPYGLHHAFTTELIAAGADIGAVAKLMGYSAPVMILNHYQYAMDAQRRNAIEHLPEIPYVRHMTKKMAIIKI